MILKSPRFRRVDEKKKKKMNADLRTYIEFVITLSISSVQITQAHKLEIIFATTS